MRMGSVHRTMEGGANATAVAYSEMLGNKIVQRTYVDKNLPHAAGLSTILTLTMLIPFGIYLAIHRKESPADTLREEGV